MSIQGPTGNGLVTTPQEAAAIVAALDDRIVDVAKAATAGGAGPSTAEDRTGVVPGSPEPTD